MISINTMLLLKKIIFYVNRVYMDLESQQTSIVKVIALLIVQYVYPFFGVPFVLIFFS